MGEKAMTAEELRQAGMEMCGEARGWQTRFAAMLKVDPSTLGRWLSAIIPVPGPVEIAVRCLLDGHRKGKRK